MQNQILETIMADFVRHNRSFIFITEEKPNILNNLYDIELSDNNSDNQIFNTMQYYWEKNRIVQVILTENQQSDLLRLINKIPSRSKYFLLISITGKKSLYSSLFLNPLIENIEELRANTQEQITVTKKDSSQSTLEDINNKYMSFEKNKPNDRLLVEQIRCNSDAIVKQLFLHGEKSLGKVDKINHLIKYIDTLLFITEQKQASFLQGKLLKWRTYDLLQTN